MWSSVEARTQLESCESETLPTGGPSASRATCPCRRSCTRTAPSIEPLTISCAETASELTESALPASVWIGAVERLRRSQQRIVRSYDPLTSTEQSALKRTVLTR